MKTVLAVDLGAGSGRVIAGRYDGKRLTLETVNRFENVPVELNGHIHWNVLSLLQNIREGIRLAHTRYGEIGSIGVDTWGVDYALLDATGRLLGLPYAYRDGRNTPENAQQVFDRIGRRALYQTTGIQFMDINTIFQLHAERRERDSLLPKASRLLFMPDLINFELSGEMANEATIASTSQLIDVQQRDWSATLLDSLEIPRTLFSTPSNPGTLLGKLRGLPGLEGVPVALVGAHDTASAVASVPADESSTWGYLATGTWALLGFELSEPVLSDLSYALSYTHEGAVNGKYRYLKNCTGMWMIQELRRAWSEGGAAPDFEALMQQALNAKPFRFFIDPDYPAFQTPGQMPEKIVAYCEKTQQGRPETQGEFYRAVMEGIVMRYREVWEELAQLTGRNCTQLHMIGGATKDALHCQMTADALNLPIVCGPGEGAAMGNAVAQLVATGDLADFTQGRRLIRDSIELSRWEPKKPEVWGPAFADWKAARARGQQA